MNTRQPGLFDRALARNTDPATSHEAAVSIAPALPDLEARVLKQLAAVGTYGATTLELAQSLRIDRVTVSPRLKPLEDKGLVVDSGIRRKGPSGRRSIVWKAIGV